MLRQLNRRMQKYLLLIVLDIYFSEEMDKPNDIIVYLNRFCCSLYYYFLLIIQYKKLIGLYCIFTFYRQ